MSSNLVRTFAPAPLFWRAGLGLAMLGFALALLLPAAPALAEVKTVTVSRTRANSTSFSVSNDVTGGYHSQMHYVLVDSSSSFVFGLQPHLRQCVEHLVSGWADIFEEHHRQRRQVHLRPQHRAGYRRAGETDNQAKQLR